MTNMPARITRTSILSGITRTLQLKQLDQEDLDKILYAYREGIIPDLKEYLLERNVSAEAAYFILDGTTKEEREEIENRV